MNIAVLTYQGQHLKTLQFLGNIVRKRMKPTVYALPLRSFKKRHPLFLHRPEQFCDTPVKEFSVQNHIKYFEITSYEEISQDFDYFIVCGAGIIPEQFVVKNRIINCHPGIIPSARGLDAFKWSIVHKIPLGNTLHLLDENVDLGKVIHIELTPVYRNDTIQSLADRHYKREIELLSNFGEYIEQEPQFKGNFKHNDSNMRMPQNMEKVMLADFNLFKNIFAE